MVAHSLSKNNLYFKVTDTTGSHQFPAMQRLSITKGHAFILVYSVCSRQSLEELRPIWQLIKEIKAETLSSIPVMLGMIQLSFLFPMIFDENLI